MKGWTSNSTTRVIGHRHRLPSLAAVALGIGLLMSADLCAMTLARGARSNYAVYLSESARPAEEKAARELVEHIKQATGAALTLVRDPSRARGPIIALGESGLPGVPRLALASQSVQASDAYEIAVFGNNVFIRGVTPRGTLYGVYYFLEKYLGCRWYAGKFTVVPKRATWQVDIKTERRTPRFRYREVFSADADDWQFSVRNRLNGQFGHRLLKPFDGSVGEGIQVRATTIFDLVDPQVHRQSHPDWFVDGQLAFGKPAVRAEGVSGAKRWLAQQPKGGYFLLISHADVNSFHNANEDKQLIDNGGAPATAFVEFVRAIANAVANDYPQVTFLVEAYQWSRKAPRVDRLPPNMGVMLSDIELDFSVPMDTERNKDFLTDVDAWSELTTKIIVWDYITNFGAYLQPYPNFSSLAPNLRLLAGRPSVIGVFEEGAYSSVGGEFAELRAWLLSRLLWDPYQNDKLLVAEFLNGYYGAAGEYIGRYIEKLQASIKADGSFLSIKVPALVGYLNEPFLLNADALFDLAERAVAKDALRLAHVHTARLGVDYAWLMRFPGRPGSTQRLARFEKHVQSSGVTASREGGEEAKVENLLRALRIPRKTGQRPAECQSLPEASCLDLSDLAFNLAGDASLVADNEAHDGVAARMAGGTTVWGIQLPLAYALPADGQWRLILSVRVDAGSGGPDETAMTMGVFPGAQVQVRVGDTAPSYRSYVLPGTWQRNRSRVAWIAPPGSNAINALYLDRIIAVRI